ncbi:MAG: hypothetical protein ABL982_15405 [Vicinamibacterales bacterium]
MGSPYVCAVCGDAITLGRHKSGWRHSSAGHFDHQVIRTARGLERRNETVADQTDTLRELWVFGNRDQSYVVQFVDGQTLRLSALHWGCDRGRAPHATAEIVAVLNPGPSGCETGGALYFDIADVVEVKDEATDTIVFKAV